MTLIELLTVLAIVMVAAWTAVPPLAAWQTRLAVETQARALFAMLVYAGAEARRLGQTVTICPLRRRETHEHETAIPDCRAGGDWSGGYAAVTDAFTRASVGASPGVPTRTVLRVQGPSAAVTITGHPASIVQFDPPTGRTIGALRNFEVTALRAGGRDTCRCLQAGAGGAWHVSEGGCAARRPGTGAALLEILVAMALLGIAGLGAAGMQQHAARTLQGAQWRVTATLLAEEAAEMLRAGLTASATESVLATRASTQWPAGSIVIADAQRGCRRVRVCWADASGHGVSGDALPGDAARRCVVVDVLP